MSSINPFEILSKLENGEITKSSALFYLRSILDNSEDVMMRIDTVEMVGIIKPESAEYFEFLENLLITEKNYQVRGLTAKVIIENYPKRAYKPIQWILEREKDELCLELISKAIGRSSNPNLKTLLS